MNYCNVASTLTAIQEKLIWILLGQNQNMKPPILNLNHITDQGRCTLCTYLLDKVNFFAIIVCTAVGKKLIKSWANKTEHPFRPYALSM